MRLSIRWRLTLWNSLALAAVLAGFGALVYGLTARRCVGGRKGLLTAETLVAPARATCCVRCSGTTNQIGGDDSESAGRRQQGR